MLYEQALKIHSSHMQKTLNGSRATKQFGDYDVNHVTKYVPTHFICESNYANHCSGSEYRHSVACSTTVHVEYQRHARHKLEIMQFLNVNHIDAMLPVKRTPQGNITPTKSVIPSTAQITLIPKSSENASDTTFTKSLQQISFKPRP